MTVDTRTALVENATALVRRQGYAAFSYADLVDRVGIRKASIHHHFPAKEDLGVAIVEAYAAQFAQRLAEIDATGRGTEAKIAAYADLYREGLASGQGCLCGVLASETAILPPRVQAGVRQFFGANLTWLEGVLQKGRAAGTVNAALDPARAARTVLATLQGALFLALSLGEKRTFDDAVDELLASLCASRP